MKMTEIEVQQLANEALRRPLSPEESGALDRYFSEHPDARADWRESVILNDSLRSLPDLEPASNFTSRVMQEVQKPERIRSSGLPARWFASWRISRSIAFAAFSFGVCTLFYHQYRVAQRTEFAETLVAVSDVARLITPAGAPSMAGGQSTSPNVQMLQDFEAIRSLRAVPVDLDLDLLKALQ